MIGTRYDSTECPHLWGGHSSFMRLLFCLLLCVAGAPARAQLLDSIRLFLREEPRVVARLDMRGSFVSNSRVSMWGGKLGLEHARRFQYGVGYSFLFTDVEEVRPVPGLGPRLTWLRLGYVNLYVDYAFYQRGPWEVRIPVQLGFGRGSLNYRDENGRRRVLDESGIILYEPAMTVQFRPVRQVGIAAGWGFRIAFNTRSSLDERITAPIYTLGVRVFLGEILRDLRGEGPDT